jgi:MoaA/NifB/PqqE/SkfB family radical SAM enzyme
LIVVWRVTTACNLNCGFCAYAQDVPFARRSIDPAAVRAFAKVLADYRRESGERVMVSWLGGEPLLWAPWRSLSAELAALRVDVSATTNGSTLGAPSVRELIVQHLTELTVSVDGIGAMHDLLRGTPGAFDRLERDVLALTRAIARAGSRSEPGRADAAGADASCTDGSCADASRASGVDDGRHAPRQRPRIRVNTVLMNDNIAQFGALCDHLQTWGIDEISFNQLGGNDRPEFHAAHKLLPTDVERFAADLPRIRESLASHGVRLVGGSRYLDRLRASAAGQSISIADCHPAEQVLFVTEAGIVAPCSFTTAEYGVPVSEIDSVAALRALSERVRAKRMASRSSWCDDCPSTQLFDKFAA